MSSMKQLSVILLTIENAIIVQSVDMNNMKCLHALALVTENVLTVPHVHRRCMRCPRVVAQTTDNAVIVPPALRERIMKLLDANLIFLVKTDYVLIVAHVP